MRDDLHSHYTLMGYTGSIGVLVSCMPALSKVTRRRYCTT